MTPEMEQGRQDGAVKSPFPPYLAQIIMHEENGASAARRTVIENGGKSGGELEEEAAIRIKVDKVCVCMSSQPEQISFR